MNLKKWAATLGVFACLSNVSYASTSDCKNEIFSPVKDSQVPSGEIYNITQPPVENPQLLSGKHVAILTSHGVEKNEIMFPYEYLIQRGAQVDILVPNWVDGGGIVAVDFLKPTVFVKSSGTFHDGLNNKYDLLVLTGGAWNAQVVRSDSQALELINDHYSKNHRPLAAICAGTSVLINAGLAKNTKLTGSPVVMIDLQNAGALVVDEAQVFNEKGDLLTSRTPNDLPQFVDGIRKLLLGQH